MTLVEPKSCKNQASGQFHPERESKESEEREQEADVPKEDDDGSIEAILKI